MMAVAVPSVLLGNINLKPVESIKNVVRGNSNGFHHLKGLFLFFSKYPFDSLFRTTHYGEIPYWVLLVREERPACIFVCLFSLLIGLSGVSVRSIWGFQLY